MADLQATLRQTMNPDRAARAAAEAQLEAWETHPGFTIKLLELIQAANAPGTPAEVVAVQQAASVYFKNTVKRWWNPIDEPEKAICDADKAQIKGLMVTYMCSMPPAVQKQMSEALSLISATDFPEKWTELLPELVSKFSLDDFHVTNGVLATANSILKRFRWGTKNDKLMSELLYCLGVLQAPLLGLFTAVAARVTQISAHPEAGGNPEAYRQLVPAMAALRTITRIFYSLNFQDLPEFFEDHMGEWMGTFLAFLSFKNATLMDPDEEDEPGPIEKLQAAIVENVSLYAEKYEEEFAQGPTPFLPGFAQAIWARLIEVGSQTKYDALASSSIKFLTAVVSKAHYSALFSGEGMLSQILTSIVVPNLMLRESDEELFEDNPTEWITKDMEGNDTETRRRCACDLVRGMGKQFEAPTTALCGEQIGAMLASHAGDTSGGTWKAKDCALQLLVAVSAKSSTGAGGVSVTNAAIDVNAMVGTHVMPELAPAADGSVNNLPILRADCLKFLGTFRNQLPKASMVAALPIVAAHLRSDSRVVVSYAAHVVERWLTVKDRPPGVAPVPRLSRADLQPRLEALFQGCFLILSKTDESFENEYVMKCVMRLLATAKADVVPLAATLLTSFNAALERVCRNPRNPQFNHYLFESTAVLVASACAADPALTSQFEPLLFPPFQAVLALDVAEFSPYVFQILAQLLEYRSDGLSEPYRALFAPLLAPANWERKGNVPALTRLLKAYLKQGAAEIVPTHLQPMLGIFQKCLAVRSTETEAFSLLAALASRSPPGALAPFLPTVLQLLLMRFQAQASNGRFAGLLVQAICHLAAVLGPKAVVDGGLEAVQAGMFTMLLTQVFGRGLEAKPPAGAEAKAAMIGMARILCESDTVKTSPPAFTALLGFLVGVMDPATAGKGAAAADDDDEGAGEEVATGDAFSRLHFTGGDGDEDYFPEVPDGPAAACAALAALAAASPGVVGPRAAALPPAQAASLAAHCTRAGVALS